MAITTLTSSLTSAANNIVSTNLRSKGSFDKVQIEYKRLGDLLEFKRLELERIPLPSQKEIQKLSSINVTNTFGSAGGLLGALAGGALDVGGLVRGFFAGKDEKIGGTPKPTKPKVNPKLSNGKLKIGGVRALGVANALFAGLDFATGLAEGESIGKSAAGTSGSLAGSLLGGVIGQSLIPIPGVGFVLGSMAGGFLGGWAADRAYDASGLDRMNIQRKQEEKLRETSKNQPNSNLQYGKGEKEQSMILSKFDSSVSKFEDFVKSTFASMVNAASAAAGSNEMMMDYGLNPDALPDAQEMPGELQDMTAEGGIRPSATKVTSGYGWRWGRMHRGVDYATTPGTPVSVLHPGRVTYARFNDGGYGNLVEVAHPGGTSTSYAHLSKITVKEGQEIEPGTVVGNVGSTGSSTGPHVHFEVRKSGTPIQIPNNEGDKYFRFGGNVKVKPKAGGQNAPSGAVNIELHASQPGGGTGLIGSYIDRPNAVTSALSGTYGSYPKNFRGSLGGPKRGLNLLELISLDRRNTGLLMNSNTREPFLNAQAQKLYGTLSKYPNVPINIFAGHNDVTVGETGTSGTSSSSINGKTPEQYFNNEVAKRVEQLAKAAGMSNIKYIRSIIANDDNDPNTNWARSYRLRTSTVEPQSQVTAPPRNPRNIDTQMPYNRVATSTLIVEKPTAVIASGGGGRTSPPPVVSSGGGGGGKVMVIQGSMYEAEKNILNKLLELPLV